MAEYPFRSCAKYYNAQHYQRLRQEQYKVDLILCPTLKEAWLDPIRKAVRDINEAAPGLCLTIVGKLSEVETSNYKYKIYISGEPNKDESSWTMGNVMGKDEAIIAYNDHPAEIYQSTEDEQQRMDTLEYMNGTAIHEMLHALGFDHEHQRHDATDFISVQATDPEWAEQMEPEEDNLGLTRFDPYSVMMYPLDDDLVPVEGDNVWTLKTNPSQCNELSELDKVGINIFYGPVQHSDYRPVLSNITGLYYCGRKVMSQRTSNIDETEFSSKCGPIMGPNCPACRVLETIKAKSIEESNKWQGWTGLVYCGTTITDIKEGISMTCGPDNGKSCTACNNILYPCK